MTALRATVIKCDGCGQPIMVEGSSVPDARAKVVELFGWVSNAEVGDLCQSCVEADQ